MGTRLKLDLSFLLAIIFFTGAPRSCMLLRPAMTERIDLASARLLENRFVF